MIGSAENAKIDVEGSGGKVRVKKRRLDAIGSVVGKLLVWGEGIVGSRVERRFRINRERR